jgi:hypothetical protein
MNYRVRRLDPYWLTNPVLPIVAVIGVLAALALINSGQVAASIAAASVGGVAILLMTQTGISAVMAVFGLMNALNLYIFFPRSIDIATMSPLMRGVSTVVFTVVFTVLMDGIILFVSVLYNLFAGVVGLGGLSIELEAGTEDGA